MNSVEIAEILEELNSDPMLKGLEFSAVDGVLRITITEDVANNSTTREFSGLDGPIQFELSLYSLAKMHRFADLSLSA